MSITSNLKKVPAKCGCEGCYFDTNKGCPIDKHIEEKGLPLPPKEQWDCVGMDETYIFVEEDINGSRV